MYAKILLIEDDDAIAAVYKRQLALTGFQSIEHFPSTEEIEQKLIDGYTQPSIILSDYFIKPHSPARYVPKLRAAKMDAPLVIASGAVEMETLNGFAMQGWIHGYFSKDTPLAVMMSRICQHLIDLNGLAQDKFDEWQLFRRFTHFLDDYTRAEAMAMRQLLLMKEPKEIAAQYDITKPRVYALHKDMLAVIPDRQDTLAISIMGRALSRLITL
ncbi:response regulator [Chitinimonas sp. BJB300]|uniref:response regulator n=1 Tax=Chitinimonas sp. BJB300 TaxID=1559339 RepID=UPI000C11CB3B|nr:response regulator [Chitinimonas sp. BJB300]PHV10904.1 hypothetical protein CSQ89_13810 [Chitinimonas sp. BJB300]